MPTHAPRSVAATGPTRCPRRAPRATARPLLLALLLLLAPAVATAQDWPARPVRLVVPFAAGGTTDLITRLLAEALTPRLGQTVVVENRAGAQGMVAMQHVAEAAPDGGAWVMATTGTLVTAPFFFKAVPYGEQDFAPVSLIARIANVLAVHPSVPASDFAGFVAHARARPGQLHYASPGSGARLATEMMRQMAGLDLVMVAYRGTAPALQDLVRGDVQLLLDLVPTALPHIQSGAVRALAVSTARRTAALPDVPSFAELGLADYDFASWQAVMGPRATPPAIVARFADAIGTAMRDPTLRQRIIALGADPVGGSPDALATLVRDDTARLGAVARAARIEPE